MVREAKLEQTQVVNAIRKFDRFIMRDADRETGFDQGDMQIAFRQWLNKSYEKTCL